MALAPLNPWEKTLTHTPTAIDARGAKHCIYEGYELGRRNFRDLGWRLFRPA